MVILDAITNELNQRIDEVAGYDYNIKKYETAITVAKSMGSDNTEFIKQLQALIDTEKQQRVRSEIMRQAVIQMLQECTDEPVP